MSYSKRQEEELRHIMKQKETLKAPNQARHKSLQAFQDGLNDASSTPEKKSKSKKHRHRLLGGIATVAAAGIAGLLLLNMNAEQEGEALPDVLEWGFKGHGTPDLEQMEENPELIETVLDRPTFDYDLLNRNRTFTINNDSYSIHLFRGWNVSEEEGELAHTIHMTSDNAEADLHLYDHEIEEDQFQQEVEDILSEITSTEETIVPEDMLVDHMKKNFDKISFTFNGVFPFDMENVSMYAFIDEVNDRFIELYISELYGQPMIYKADFPLDDKESWTTSWLAFSFMRIVDIPYTIQGSETEHHPEYNRPIEKKVVLDVGATHFEEIDIELYVDEELEMTSYLPKGTEIEQIEHEHFTEWRFTEPGVSENSFYSFGKLKNDFPVPQGKQIMFDAFNIDLSYEENLGGGTPYHYAYVSGPEGDFTDGYIQLFESRGEWYYKHKHADREDYNGGVYTQRLRMFIDSIKWH